MGAAGGHRPGKFEPRLYVRILECSGNTDGQVQPQSLPKLNLQSLKLCFYKLPGDSVILCKCGPAGLVHLYLSTEKLKTRNTRQKLGLQPCPLKFWLETPKIRKPCHKPSLRSLPPPTPTPPHVPGLQLQCDGGSVLLTAPTPGHGCVPLSYDMRKTPQFLVLSSIYSVTGARQACQRTNPGIVREAELQWIGYLSCLVCGQHFSLQSPPTSTY